MPDHIAHARGLCEDAGIGNLTLHGHDFASAIDLDLPRFDYIVAHGVYSWIDARSREALRRFIDRWLAPGGLVYVSYNTAPGWAADAPFQYLIREIAATCTGNSVDRFRAAMDQIQALIAAGAPPLQASFMANSGWQQMQQNRPIEYFAHEYLQPTWEPMYVSQVRADMSTIGLHPAGSATIADNFDSFVLTAAAREALSKIEDPNLRELTSDFFLDQRFRRDVFVRDATRLADDERSSRLSECVFDLQRPAELVQYTMRTEAGHVDFDNPTAHAVVETLADGPKRVIDIPVGDNSRSGLLGNALTLFAANELRVVGPGTANVDALNRVLLGRHEGVGTISYLALPVGTAVEVPLEVFNALRDGSAVPNELQMWREYLARYRS